MNDMRERLIELINYARDSRTGQELAERIADYLIANGVTVQEWISVEDSLPEDGEHILVRYSDEWICDEYSPVDDGVTHWMPLPKQPKGE